MSNFQDQSRLSGHLLLSRHLPHLLNRNPPRVSAVFLRQPYSTRSSKRVIKVFSIANHVDSVDSISSGVSIICLSMCLSEVADVHLCQPPPLKPQNYHVSAIICQPRPISEIEKPAELVFPRVWGYNACLTISVPLPSLFPIICLLV